MIHAKEVPFRDDKIFCSILLTNHKCLVIVNVSLVLKIKYFPFRIKQTYQKKNQSNRTRMT